MFRLRLAEAAVTKTAAAETEAAVAPPAAPKTAGKETKDLAARAQEVHAKLDPIAQKQRTTAVLETNEGTVVGGGKRDLTPAQRAVLKPGETAAKAPGKHAEETVIQNAQRSGAKPQNMSVTRTICTGCQKVIKASGGTVGADGKSATWTQ